MESSLSSVFSEALLCKMLTKTDTKDLTNVTNETTRPNAHSEISTTG